MDAREALGEHGAHAEQHRRHRRRLARRALTPVLAADQDAAARRLRAADEVGVDVAEGELGDGRHVGPEHQHRGAGGRDVVGGDLVAELQEHRRLERLRNRFAERNRLDVGPAHDLAAPVGRHQPDLGRRELRRQPHGRLGAERPRIGDDAGEGRGGRDR